MWHSCPPVLGFSLHFFLNRGCGENLGTTTCAKTVVGGKQGHAPCRILSLRQNLFCMSIEFHGNHKTVTKLR